MEKKESDGNHSVKISVIVPVYNAENTIEKSLSNLLHQTMLEKRENGIKILPEIEILLINDCSTDNSLAILNKIQNDYPNLVKVLDLPENHGPGGARNYGLDAASGEYIGFMDCDDTLNMDMDKLEEFCEKECTLTESGLINKKPMVPFALGIIGFISDKYTC